MKGHRSRGKAKQVVAAGHGRCVRLPKKSLDTSTGTKRAARLLTDRRGHPAPSIVRSAKEKQEARARRAVKKQTNSHRLGRAIRDKVAQMREFLWMQRKENHAQKAAEA